MVIAILCFKAGRHGMVMDKALRPINQKLKQLDSEFPFPIAFVYVPRMHHVLIIRKCKTIDEALFFIQKTIENGWSHRGLKIICNLICTALEGKSLQIILTSFLFRKES